MDHNIYDNDFEEFLKQKSDQYKMYPSDRVWNNIYSSLHGRKKWWALGFSLLFIGAGLMIGRQSLLSGYNRMAGELNDNTATASPVNPAGRNSNAFHDIRQYALPSVPVNASPGHMAVGSMAITTKEVKATNNKSQNMPMAELIAGISVNNAGATAGETEWVIENNPLPAMPIINNHPGIAAPFSIPQKQLVLNENMAVKANSIKEETNKPINQVEQAAVNPVQPSKWSLLFYGSPTISYRRLTNLNPQVNNNIVPLAVDYAGNINRYVHHKPAPGFELGTNAQYRLSNSLSIFGGIQLNYSRYYIDAYKYITEKASIAVNNSSGHDTLSGYTNIRNFSGYAPEQLQNKYLQLSLPVGIEIKLVGEKKLQFSIAGGIQPTFLLNSTSYLISSDYKNYIQSPDLARGFNVHTNFEAILSYRTGGLKWQIGPQFRSQLLSSYSNQYRVREYLTEYGIKFGVSKSF